jgi:dTDP-4-dehydrorhamnose 3,5-epimerase
MIFNSTEIDGAYLVDVEKIEDERGYFTKLWVQKEFEKYGLSTSFVDFNLSHSYKRGTLRGLHYQIPPYQETKLIRCIRGSIMDVIIDIRPNSSSYLKLLPVELSSDNCRALYIPFGVAHGFQTLEDQTEVFYQATQQYIPGAERGIRWNDPVFNMDWPIKENITITEKDSTWPDFKK